MQWGSTWRGESLGQHLSGSQHQREPPVRLKQELNHRQTKPLHAKHQEPGLPRRVPLLPSKLGVPGVLVQDAKCERAVGAFFKCLDRASGGYGYVDETLALRLWPTLTKHVAGAGARALEQKLRQRKEPIGQTEWLVLMSALCSMSGVRLFLSSVLSAWVLLEEESHTQAKSLAGTRVGYSLCTAPGRPGCTPGSQNNSFFAQAERVSHVDACSNATGFHRKTFAQERLSRIRSLPSMLPPLNCAQTKCARSSEVEEASDTLTDTGSSRPESACRSQGIADTEVATPDMVNMIEKIGDVEKPRSGVVSTQPEFAGTSEEIAETQRARPETVHTIEAIANTEKVRSGEVAVVAAAESSISAVEPATGQVTLTETVAEEGAVAEEPAAEAAMVDAALTEAAVLDATPPDTVLAEDSAATVEVIAADTAAAETPPAEAAEAEAPTVEFAPVDATLEAAAAELVLAEEPTTGEPAAFEQDTQEPASPGIVAAQEAAQQLVDEVEELTELSTMSETPKEGVTTKVAKKSCRISKNRKSSTQNMQSGAGGAKRSSTRNSVCVPKQAAMRRGTSEPLPALPRVPVAVPNCIRLARAVSAWKAKHPVKLRIGNVFKVMKEFGAGCTWIQCGTWGRVQGVSEDGSAEIVIDAHNLTAEVSKDGASNLDVQVVTHEVRLISKWGQPIGKSISCIVTAYQSEGFLDILCQDGRHQSNVHSFFMRELPEAEYTDVGYVGYTSPASTSSAFEGQSLQQQIAQRMLELQDGHDAASSSTWELPPAGYVGSGAGVACTGMFSMGSMLNAERAKIRMAQADSSNDEQHRDGQDGCATETLLSCAKQSSCEAPAADPGGSVCPFVEIGDSGLRDMITSCAFTSQDVVFDVGCGRGKMLDKILESFPCRGIGVEVNPGLARFAEKRLWRYSDRARVVLDDVRNVDLTGATAVVCYMLSHSFNSHGAALKEHFAKSLRPGCVVLNSTYPVPGWCGSYRNGVYRYIIGEHLPSEDPSATSATRVG